MATADTSANTPNIENDITHPAAAPSAVERLPKRYADESYVQYLAAEVDRARAERDQARADEKKSWDRYCDAAKTGIEQAARADKAELEVARVKATRWSDRAPFVLVGVFLICCAAAEVARAFGKA